MSKSSPTALILDHQDTILQLTALHLKRIGHNTIQCSSVREAVEQFNRSHIDLLIADVSLPDGSGVHTGLKLWELRPTLKILFMSGHDLDQWQTEDATQLRRLPQDCVRILQKPFSGPGLLENVAALIDLPRPAEQRVPDLPERDPDAAHRLLVINALERQADLLELAHDAIMVRNLDGTIQFWNRGAETLYGWNRDHAAGRRSHELLRTILPVPFAVIERSLNTTGRWDGELHQTTRDETTVIVSSRWAVRNAVDGQVEILEINRDITAQKKIAESFLAVNRELQLRMSELDRAEERFRSLVESAPDAMVITTVNGEIALVNAATEILFGYSRDEVIGKNVDVLLPARFHAVHSEHRHGYARNPHLRRTGSGLKLFGLRKNGEEFPVEIALSPLKTAEGILISSAIRDVSDRLNVRSN